MAFVPVPDTCLAVLRFTKGVESFSNTLWYTMSGFTDVDMLALAAGLNGVVDTDWKPDHSTDVFFTGVTVYDMTSPTGSIVTDNSDAGAGASAEEPLPLSLAIVVTLYTAARGRTGRGRMYIGGTTEFHMTDGVYTAQYQSAINAYVALLGTVPSSLGWTWSVVSRMENGAPREFGVSRPIINTEIRSAIPGTQRRRLDRP